MQLQLIDNLPMITAVVAYLGAATEISNVLIDTGSATSIFNADEVAKVKLTPDPQDILFTIHGVGGSEAVFSRRVDYVQVGDYKLSNFQIEIGGMDYGFDILGILGMDFLAQSGAIINFDKQTIQFTPDQLPENNQP